MDKHNTRVLYLRKQISEAFERMWQYPLTVVEAPMGYGKTTAVRESLKDCKAEILWQTVLSNSESDFWRGFSRLFANIDAECAVRLKDLGIPNSTSFLQEAVEILEEVDFQKKTVLVIDDYHSLSSPYIDRFIEFLIKCMPHNLYIVIISRISFGENTTELALKGCCQVIDKRYFEFTQEEIIAYYNLCGIKLKPKEAAKLYEYTEGWISALYLCMMGYLQDGRIEKQASLYELIEKVVYRQCPNEVKEFLLTICIFENFTLAQAEFIWSKENTEAILQYLMAKNAFLKYNSLTKTYQLHNVFSGYLQEILGQRETEYQSAILCSAGEWYVSIEEYLHALEYFYKVGDFDRLLTVIELDKGIHIGSEQKEALIRYFSECPLEVRHKHLVACMIYAIILFILNEMELFMTQCREIGEYIEEDPAVDVRTKNWLSGELAILYSFTKYNDLAAMGEYQRKAQKLLTGPSKFMSNQFPSTFGSPSVLYLYYRESGQLTKTIQDSFRNAPHYLAITDGHGFGSSYVMQAEGYYYCGDFANAELITYKALYKAKSHKQFAIMLCAWFLQIRLAMLKGDLSYVLAALRQMRENIKQKGIRDYICTIEFCEGFVYAYLNRPALVPASIAAGEIEEACFYFPNNTFYNIIFGRFLLISGQYLKLIALADQFIATAGFFPNLLGHIYTYIYVAAAYYKIKAYSKAKAVLRQALALAMPDQMVMPFVENGEEIAGILPELKQDSEYAGFIGHIRKIFLTVGKNVNTMRAGLTGAESVEHLSAREKEISALVIRGLSNRTIAESLNIAEITVKKTLQNIYGKLHVRNRTALTKFLMDRKEKAYDYRS